MFLEKNLSRINYQLRKLATKIQVFKKIKHLSKKHSYFSIGTIFYHWDRFFSNIPLYSVYAEGSTVHIVEKKTLFDFSVDSELQRTERHMLICLLPAKWEGSLFYIEK